MARIVGTGGIEIGDVDSPGYRVGGLDGETPSLVGSTSTISGKLTLYGEIWFEVCLPWHGRRLGAMAGVGERILPGRTG